MAGEKLKLSYIKKEPTGKELQNLRTIPQFLENISKLYPEKEGVVFVSTDGKREAVTFNDVYIKSRQVAQALLSFGIKPREIIAINLRTCPEWLYILFGAILADIIPIGISLTYADGEDFVALINKLENCSCLVFDPGFQNEKWNILQQVLGDYDRMGNVNSPRMPSLRYLLCHDQDSTLSDMKPLSDLFNVDDSGIKLPEAHENDIAVLFQTSGSTGVPKIVAHTHRSISNIARVDPEVPFAQGTYLSERPFSWIGGFPFTLLYGQTRIAYSEFCQPPEDPTAFMLETVRRENCVFLFTLPPRLPEYLQRKEEFNASPLQMLFVGGQPISRHILSLYKQLCPYILVSYGGTEILSAAVNLVTDADKNIEYCVGPILDNTELKIVNEKGDVVPVNSQGEIYVRGVKLFKEYFNDPEKTMDSFTHDGWFKTDDLGRLTEDGLLIVEGRRSNMILSGGFNVNPDIQENLISKCPGVEAVCIVPIPDDVMYQVICACVKIEPGSDVDENVIKKYCESIHADKMGSFTVLPKFYMIFDTFPETYSGKVSRKKLASIAIKRLKM